MLEKHLGIFIQAFITEEWELLKNCLQGVRTLVEEVGGESLEPHLAEIHNQHLQTLTLVVYVLIIQAD